MKKCLQISSLILLLVLMSGGNTFAVSPNVVDLSPSVQAKNGVCQGIVTDAKGEPIIGASVQVKGTTNGVQTDLDGRFSIRRVPNGATILIKYVGYKDQEVKWDGQSLKIVLHEDNKLLDEVVVVGYGTQKKVNVTGAVSTVDSKSLESRPVQNVAQALQGKLPGLNFSVGNNGGALGSGMTIKIRGAGTIGEGSEGNPLVLIDGVEGDMNTINPNDIANISVLKDAASSSIYGARAAFGVILITTKSGKSGKTTISYIGNMRFSTAIQRPEMVSSVDFARYFNAAQKNTNGTTLFDEATIQKMKDFINHKYTDPNTPEYYGTAIVGSAKDYAIYNRGAFANTNWFDEFYIDNVPSYEHSLSVSGGSDKVTYLFSTSYLDQNGLLRHGKDKFKRFTINARISADLFKWLKVNYFNKWTRSEYSRPTYIELDRGVFFHNIARRWPVNPKHVPGGFFAPWQEMDALTNGGITLTQENTITNKLQFVFEPVKNWHITLDGSIRQFYSKVHSEMLPFLVHVGPDRTTFGKLNNHAPGYSHSREDRYFNNYYQTNITSDYTNTIGRNDFKVLGGFNAELYTNDWMVGEGTDLVSAKVPYISSAQSLFKANNNIKELAIAGFFARVNYSYDKRYLLEANIRYDGSSRFIGDKRWGLFPSISLGWNVANEEFFSPFKSYISVFKLRGSWGRLGNNTIKAWYPFYSSIYTGLENSAWLIDNKRLNTAGIPPIVSDVLTWEKIESWNTGFDVAALNNRLTANFDYYRRYTYDMVGPAPTLPAILGTEPPRINNADMVSYGWEMQLNWKDQIADFYYGVGLNLSDTQNEILRYPNESGNIYDYYKGKMVGEIWGYKTVGLAQNQKEMDEHLKTNLPNWGTGWGPGDVMFQDLNGDGKVTSGANTLDDHGDLIRVGNSTPRYSFGVNLYAQWKGVDLSIFLQGIGKRDYWLSGPYFWGAAGSMWQAAVFKEHLDYWRPDNKNAYYPRPLFNNGMNQKVQSRFVQNAAYIRLKNIQLGYTLPLEWTKKALINKFRIYVSADNLVTLTKISGVFDPETLGGNWGAGKTYPLQRVVSCGVNINF